MRVTHLDPKGGLSSFTSCTDDVAFFFESWGPCSIERGRQCQSDAEDCGRALWIQSELWTATVILRTRRIRGDVLYKSLQKMDIRAASEDVLWQGAQGLVEMKGGMELREA